jgi:hypothetical protein
MPKCTQEYLDRTGRTELGWNIYPRGDLLDDSNRWHDDPNNPILDWAAGTIAGQYHYEGHVTRLYDSQHWHLHTLSYADDGFGNLQIVTGHAWQRAMDFHFHTQYADCH